MNEIQTTKPGGGQAMRSWVFLFSPFIHLTAMAATTSPNPVAVTSPDENTLTINLSSEESSNLKIGETVQLISGDQTFSGKILGLDNGSAKIQFLDAPPAITANAEIKLAAYGTLPLVKNSGDTSVYHGGFNSGFFHPLNNTAIEITKTRGIRADVSTSVHSQNNTTKVGELIDGEFNQLGPKIDTAIAFRDRFTKAYFALYTHFSSLEQTLNTSTSAERKGQLKEYRLAPAAGKTFANGFEAALSMHFGQNRYTGNYYESPHSLSYNYGELALGQRTGKWQWTAMFSSFVNAKSIVVSEEQSDSGNTRRTEQTVRHQKPNDFALSARYKFTPATETSTALTWHQNNVLNEGDNDNWKNNITLAADVTQTIGDHNKINLGGFWNSSAHRYANEFSVDQLASWGAFASIYFDILKESDMSIGAQWENASGTAETDFGKAELAKQTLAVQVATSIRL